MITNKKVQNSTPPKILSSLKGKNSGIFIVFIVLFVFFSLASNTFLSAGSLINMILQISTIMIISMGMSWIIQAGCIDLSTGATMAFCGVVTVMIIKNFGLPIPLALLLCILMGGAIGIINGTIVTKVKISPLLTTIGTSTAIKGLAFMICGGKTIYGLPESFSAFGRGYLFGVLPYPVIISVCLIVLFIFIQNKSAFAVHTYAVGNNQDCAYLSGIKPQRHILKLYLIIGLLVGLAAFINASRMGVGTASTGDNIDFEIITAVVLGGTSIFGGSGKIQGTVLGCVIMGILTTGMMILNMHSFVQQFAKGVILLVAIGSDTIRTKKEY